jgi:hypothetical protein
MRFSGEPELAEMLSDPIVEALMRADGWDRRSVCASLLSAKEAVAPSPFRDELGRPTARS